MFVVTQALLTVSVISKLVVIGSKLGCADVEHTDIAPSCCAHVLLLIVEKLCPLWLHIAIFRMFITATSPQRKNICIKRS